MSVTVDIRRDDRPATASRRIPPGRPWRRSVTAITPPERTPPDPIPSDLPISESSHIGGIDVSLRLLKLAKQNDPA